MLHRNNHYLPEWYQKGFLADGEAKLHCLDLTPDKKELDDGRLVTMNCYAKKAPSKFFVEEDLYTTGFGPFLNDEIERFLFGEIDRRGAVAVRAYLSDSLELWHRHFEALFEYVDAQKLRTPKGLTWINSQYQDLSHSQLMREMQAIRRLNCTMWGEGVREIVSAKKCNANFIISDHPVTIYNAAFDPVHERCIYPNDPSIALVGSQTVFPLDRDHCLILTNYEHARDPRSTKPDSRRTNARNFGFSYAMTDALIRGRELSEKEVKQINLIIKLRAKRFLGSTDKQLLFPEDEIDSSWTELGKVLLPPSNEVSRFGGTAYLRFEDGSTRYQDAYGRTSPPNKHLDKDVPKGEPERNKLCICGSGKKFKNCCKDKPHELRPTAKVLSIRERNLIFCRGLKDILELQHKGWNQVRSDISREQIQEIYTLYGDLWPLDTDIVSLLPKPDGDLRALYTGVIDPRTVLSNIPNLCLYFDEVLIQSPIMNPLNLKGEHSPIDSPDQYLYQTLKNVIFFISLEPYIDEGYINVFPDPVGFSDYMRKQVFEMVRGRTQSVEIGSAEKKYMEALYFDDFQRAVFMTSEDQQRETIRRENPEGSQEEIEEVLKTFVAMKFDDPFSPLNENTFGSWGQQLLIQTIAPNFEVSMFLAKLTGSVFTTDSQFRWKELVTHNRSSILNADSNFKEIEQAISEFNYLWETDYTKLFAHRLRGTGSKLRKVHKEILSLVVNGNGYGNRSSQSLLNDLLNAQNQLSKDFQKSPGLMPQMIKCVIPDAGFTHINVQRMIVSNGIYNHLDRVPMALFFGA